MTNTPRNVTELQALVTAGAQLEYVFFWGHEPKRPGIVGAECCSQWYPAEFVVDDVRYLTAEHYMMAQKARLFGDEQTRAHILEAESPGAAKALGRKVRGFHGELWEQHRSEIVVAGNVAKFSQHTELGSYLAGTRERVLAEASPTDAIWGIGLAEADPRAQNPPQWQGVNLLGFALMRVRDQLCA